MIVAGLLIVVAIAGIVLSGRKGADTSSSAAAPTAADSVTPAASAAPTAALPATGPNEVLFAAGSDKLPPGAAETIARFVETARAGNKGVRIGARYLTGADKAKNFELAKARGVAVRHAVMADGITGDRIQMELSEVAAGTLTDRAANLIELSTR